MKNILRILHLGGGSGATVGDQHHRLPRSPSPATSPSSSSPAAAPAAPDPGGAEEPGRDAGGGAAATAPADFGFFEEEFQVQLALAISVSDPDGRKDPESLQIDAAKRISLGCPVGSHVTMDNLEWRVLPATGLVAAYPWHFDRIVNYNERVRDGFYDICGIISNRNIQGNLTSLVDLQAIFTTDGLDYDVVLVNRAVDPALQQLERMALSIALECRRAGLDPIASGLVQKIADVVVERMGGPVVDADDMLRTWKNRSHDLRVAYKTTVLPLGCLDIGLSHHRALLFKVLADKIGLPCRLVKGSYYTGTDEGAVNLIKSGPDCEYIIDLMGAPGALIPAEVPSIQLHTAAVDILSSTAIADSVTDLCSELDEKLNSCLQQSGGTMGGPGQSSSVPLTTVTSVSTAFADDEPHFALSSQTASKFKNCGPQLGRFLPHQETALDQSSETKKNLSFTQKKKVKNVSKYVISAAQNPEFAQKLHAVLLESGASPPPDLFSDINLQQGVEDDKKSYQNCSPDGHKRKEESQAGFPLLPKARLNSSAVADCENGKKLFALGTFRNHKSDAESRLADCNYRNIEGPDNAFSIDQSSITSKAYGENSHGTPGQRCCLGGMHIGFLEPKGDNCLEKCQDSDKGCAGTLLEVENDTQVTSSEESSNSLRPLLGDVAGYEIQWEDLQLGERIGLGSFGEVYRADWNGTEVAVKKFLGQDFSGDALEQFRSEIKIMLRLRHPNVVLFMGAVMRPPNLSILTEFLPRGSLYRLLHRPNVQLDEKRRLKMALDVAKGMNYLHTSHPTIVHRDLKSPNLLVDKNWVVKVCDFGLSRLKHHTFLSSKSTAGTPEWMAPEVLRNEPSNEKCDVYSFGVILWELATMCMPWSGMNPMQVVGAVGFQNRRLNIPNEVDPMVAQVIQDCWHSEPSLRPSFSQLMDPLKQLKRCCGRLNVTPCWTTVRSAASGIQKVHKLWHDDWEKRTYAYPVMSNELLPA